MDGLVKIGMAASLIVIMGMAGIFSYSPHLLSPAPFSLNESESPGNNLFGYVNDIWISHHPIQSNKSYYNAFSEVDDRTTEQLHTLFDSESDANNITSNLIGTFYRSGMNEAAINSQGISQIADELDRISRIQTRQDVVNSSIHLLIKGINPLYSYYADQDPTHASRIIPHLFQGGIGLPDRDDYFRNDSESVNLQKEYRIHIRNVFLLLNETPQNASVHAEKVYALEKELAESHYTTLENRDPQNTTHILSFVELNETYPDFGWDMLRTIQGSGSSELIDVHQLSFIERLDTLLRDVSVDDWKTFLTYQLVNSMSPYLSSQFELECFMSYSHQMSGVSTMDPRWKRVLFTVNRLLGDEVGKKYVETYFQESSRQNARDIVDSIRDTMRERLANLTWMDDQTKEMAKEKLDAIREKIGYPDNWMDYSGLNLTDSYAGNVLAGSEFLFLHGPHGLDKIGKPVDRSAWFIYPQDVNAYYSPAMNDIVIPAAILQPPFFDPAADNSINYGGIGAIIGHELTHGFDDEGRKYDKEGNLVNWWTDKAAHNFQLQADLIVSQYNKFEVVPGLHIDGNLTLGENIADFGGLTLAFHAWEHSRKSTIEPEGHGTITPQQQVFLSFAQIWRGVGREEYIRALTYSDPHSWIMFRVNGAPFNVPEFYEAFPGIGVNDTLYRKTEERPVIW